MSEKTNKIPVSKKAKEVAAIIKSEKPDYFYLKELFRHLRKELNIKVQTQAKKLPYVPSEEDMKKYYDVVWHSQNQKHMVMIKLMLYTGIRVGELIKVKLIDVDHKQHQIRVQQRHGEEIKERQVPFPENFKEALSKYMREMKKKGSIYLFESGFQNPYSEQGIRKILKDYTALAKMEHTITPHKLRHFLFTWMKKNNIDDEFIHAYSGHESRQALDLYSKLSITEAQNTYNQVIPEFPI